MKHLFLVAITMATIFSCQKTVDEIVVDSVEPTTTKQLAKTEQGVLNWNWATLDYQLFTENFDLVCSSDETAPSCIEIYKLPNQSEVRFLFTGWLPDQPIGEETFWTHRYDFPIGNEELCLDEPMWRFNFSYPSENSVLVRLRFTKSEWECMEELAWSQGESAVQMGSEVFFSAPRAVAI